jgi:hypothetical protein
LQFQVLVSFTYRQPQQMTKSNKNCEDVSMDTTGMSDDQSFSFSDGSSSSRTTSLSCCSSKLSKVAIKHDSKGGRFRGVAWLLQMFSSSKRRNRRRQHLLDCYELIHLKKQANHCQYIPGAPHPLLLGVEEDEN